MTSGPGPGMPPGPGAFGAVQPPEEDDDDDDEEDDDSGSEKLASKSFRGLAGSLIIHI